MAKDHERIWLQHGKDADPGMGRMWCQDKVWPGEDDDGEPTEYVRADIHATAIRLLTEEVEKMKGEAIVAPAECSENCDDPHCPYSHKPLTLLEAYENAVSRLRTAEAEAASLRQKLVVARKALEPLATLDVHYPQKRRYGNRPSSGSIMQVSTHEHPDAEITVEHIHDARAALEATDA